MWSKISIVRIPDRKFTKLFTNVLSMSEIEDVDMHIGFEMTGKSAIVCMLSWKTEELLEASFIFIKFKLKSP